MSDLPATIVDDLGIGGLAPLGSHPTRGDVISGIAKQSAAGRVRLGLLGFEGDAQADRRHHGGVDKAIHHYAVEHYAFWREILGDQPLLAAGGFGENISTAGLVEADVCIGDVVRLGSALVQVSQGRQPCWKLNLRFGCADLSRRVQATRRTGWYYRVLEEGVVERGDRLDIIERPAPAWTVDRALALVFRQYPPGTPADAVRAWLREAAALPGLSAGWQETFSRRLAHDEADDGRRLDG